MTMSSINRAQVIIAGAGISGLSAAKLLSEYGVKVIVLEASERVGGRTHTLRDPSYQYTDVGGAYIGPAQRRVARMAKELGLEFYFVNEDLPTVMHMNGRRMKFKGLTPPLYNVFGVLDMNNIVQVMNKMAKQVPRSAPWKAPKAREWDTMTYQEFLNKHAWTRYGQKLGEIFCREVLCVEPHEVSLLYVLWYVIQGQSFQRLTTVTRGAQERKFVGGAMQLSERMAEKVGLSNIKFSQPVIKVEQKENGEMVVTTGSGDVYHADYVISAMPQSLLNRVTFDPVLPPLKLQMMQRIPMGCIIKTMTFYKTAFWREKGFSGQMVSDLDPVQYCIDDTKPDGSHPCIMGFIQSSAARSLMSLSVEERKKAVCEHYAKVFGCDLFKDPVNYVEKNWAAEQYAGGCYVGSLGPGVLTDMAHVLRQPHGRVYFAGTETATEWSGYMEGAIQAGERAARQVLNASGKLPLSQIYLEEPPSDYFPETPPIEMAIEKWLPSVGQFLVMCTVSLAAVAGILVKKFAFV